MLELLNQLDGFDTRGDVKVVFPLPCQDQTTRLPVNLPVGFSIYLRLLTVFPGIDYTHRG